MAQFPVSSEKELFWTNESLQTAHIVKDLFAFNHVFRQNSIKKHSFDKQGVKLKYQSKRNAVSFIIVDTVLPVSYEAPFLNTYKAHFPNVFSFFL